MSRPVSLMRPETPVQVLLERLEYGKFCARKNGPIEPYAEHGVLGFTSGFPPELRNLCTPRQLGLGDQYEQSTLTAAANHGIVLRPVKTKQLRTVCYRIGTRPEGGDEQPHSRHYITAQYLTGCAGEVSPLEFLQSIQTPHGITREMAGRLEPAAIRREDPWDGDVATDLFLREAIVYVLSGIGVDMEADETEFFRLADRLWHRLPDSARVLFSAGWNAGRSLSRVLMIGSATGASRERPVYHATAGKWSTAGKFTARDLFPGRMYVFREFGASELPDTCDAPSAADGDMPQLPDLSDPATWSAVRREGLLLRDDYLLDRVRTWFESGNVYGISADNLAKIASTLLAGSTKTRFVEWCCRAIDDESDDRAKQRRLIWAVLTNDSKVVLRCQTAVGQSTIAWLKRVRANDAPGALEVFCEASGLDPLPDEEAAPVWEQLLNASLDTAECWGSHIALINSRRGGEYRRWAAQNAMRLAINLGDGSVIAALSERYELDAGSASALRRLLAGAAPTDDDVSWLSTLSETDTQRLARLLERLWKKRRPVVLAWAEQLAAEFFEDDFLKIAAGGQVGFARLAACVQQAAGLNLESWFMGRLAAEALREVERLRDDIESQPAAWREVIELWPAQARLIVVDMSPAMPPKEQEVSWSPTREELQERIEFWFSEGRQYASNRVRAAGILEAAGRMNADQSKPLSAVDICGGFARGEFIEGTPTDDSQAILAAQVVKAAGMRLPVGVAKEAWAHADKGWQLRLLIDTCGFLDEFEPTPVQLTALIAHRRWLVALLDGDVAPKFGHWFGVLKYDFQEADPSAWQEKYAGSPLWAAFRGLPRHCRGPLKDALRAYADSTEEVVNRCLLHLECYHDELACQEVLEAYVLPRVRKELTRDAARLTDILMAMARGVGNRKAYPKFSFRKQREIQLEPACELDGVLFQKGKERGKIRVAALAFALIWKILRNPQLPRILAQVTESGKHG